MLGADLDTGGISLTGIADVRFFVDDLDDFFRTFGLAGTTADASAPIYCQVFAQGNALDRAGLGTDAAENAIGILILQVPVVIIGLNIDPGFGWDIGSLLHAGTDLCAELAADAFFFCKFQSFHSLYLSLTFFA